MLSTYHCIQQLEPFFPEVTSTELSAAIFNLRRRANEPKRCFSHFRSVMETGLCFTFGLPIPDSHARRVESWPQLRNNLKNKVLKNRKERTIIKSDTSFCALFRRILLKGGDEPFDPFGQNYPNIKVR
jgi:hypothetical protein